MDLGTWNAVNKITPNVPFYMLGSLVSGATGPPLQRPLYMLPSYATVQHTQAVNQYGDVRNSLGWQRAWLAAPGTPDALVFPVDFASPSIWDDRVCVGMVMYRAEKMVSYPFLHLFPS